MALHTYYTGLAFLRVNAPLYLWMLMKYGPQQASAMLLKVPPPPILCQKCEWDINLDGYPAGL